MQEIMENATIIYKNGLREIFDAISIANKGVYTGQIRRNDKEIEFINHSYIPNDQIERILIFNNGTAKDIDIKKTGRKK